MIYDKEYIGRFLEKQRIIDYVFNAVFKGFVCALVFGLIMCAASMIKHVIL